MPGVPFLCFETPYCVWDVDIRARNVEYIQNIDPEFFQTGVYAFGELLKVEDRKHHAATGLRFLYTHALETLLALLGATAQAPNAVFAWLLKYREPHLCDFAEAVTNRRPLKHCLNVDQLTWAKFSELVHQSLVLDDKDKEKQIKQGYGRFWGFAAGQYTRRICQDEYNSIKHGLRVRSGGHILRVGIEPEFGVPAPPEAMKTVMASDYGTSFLSPEPIAQNKISFGVKSCSTGWHPQSLISCIQLVSFSIANLKSFLLSAMGHDVTQLRFCWPQELALFDMKWIRKAPGSESTTFGPVIDMEEITFMNKDEVIAAYDRVSGDTT